VPKVFLGNRGERTCISNLHAQSIS
jgi:hypothetical protein